MKVYKTRRGILVEHRQLFYLLKDEAWDPFINDNELYEKIQRVTSSHAPVNNGPKLIESALEPPVGSQEIWASGVTYYNSKRGREEEAEEAGGSDFYGRVYDAERPELFFKATRSRTVTSGELVHIREDSTWDVPEPELTLVVTSTGTIVGYTIGNDMSSRSIEGENPLYLPQAKCYDGSASVGPCIYVTNDPLSAETTIEIQIQRNSTVVFADEIAINQIKRKFVDLVSYLYRACSFPDGSLLMTGTGIVPSSEFTLYHGDEISITIAPIGTLINKVG